MSDHPFPAEVEQACAKALHESDEIEWSWPGGRLSGHAHPATFARIVLARLAEFGEEQVSMRGGLYEARRWTYATPWQEKVDG